MRRRLACALAAACIGATPALAGGASADEATALVRKGIAYLQAQGKDRAFAEFSDHQGAFVDRDLYLTVYDMDGVVRAHGVNERMIGKNLIELRDVDGKAFVKERLELARSRGSFWQEYKFLNPVTRKIEPKRMYCERSDDLVVCSGIYR